MKKYLFFVLLISLVGCSAIKTNIMEPEEIDVGALSKNERDMLWEVAEEKCLDMTYNISSGDKDTGNLICQTLVGSATWTMSIKITESGFKVTHQSNELIDSLNVYLAKRKKDMETTLADSLKNKDENGKSIVEKKPEEVKSIENKEVSENYLLRAQERLIELGYNPGVADGISGPQTKKALLKYQEDMGLLPTGELNQATIMSLEIK